MSVEWPDRWERITVEEAGEVALGRQRSPQHHTGRNMRPYLRVANVFEDRIDLSDVMEMNFTPEEATRFALQPKDILLNEGQSKHLVGRPAMWRGELPGACFTNSLVRFRARSGVDPDFALALFLHYLRDGTFQNIATITTNIAHLGAGKFAKLWFPRPPLDEQRRIVAKLDALRARSRRARDALDAVPALLDRLRQSILAAAFRGDLTAEWREQHPDVEPASELLKRIRIERRQRWEQAELAKMIAKGKPPKDDRWKSKYVEPEPPDESDLPEIPAGWTWATFESVGTVDLGRQRAPQYAQGVGTRPYLRVANIKDDRIDFADVNEMDFDDAEFAHYSLRSGDILLSEGQSPHLVGQSAIYRGEVEGMCFQKTLHRFRRYEASPSAEYFQLLFRHYVRAGVFRAVASLTTNIAHLTLVRLKPLAVPLPPLPEAEAITKRTSAMLARVEALATMRSGAASALRDLDGALLASAFRGELLDRQSDRPPVVYQEAL